jgi:hypothetical protein
MHLYSLSFDIPRLTAETGRITPSDVKHPQGEERILKQTDPAADVSDLIGVRN